MQQTILCIAACLLGGLLMSRLAKKLSLPAVTTYLIAGLLLGPFLLGKLGFPGLGFQSLEMVESFSIISQVALGFIAFAIGNEFRTSELKHMGHQAVAIGILQAVITTALVDVVLIVVHLLNPQLLSLPAAITLGAIAAATAPAATLMVVRQYKANGPLTKLLLMVVAIDDAVGLVLFSASIGVAQALEVGNVSLIAVVLEPIIEIVLSLILGAGMGFLLSWVERFYHSRSKRLSIVVAVVMLTVGLSMTKFAIGPVHCGFSLLLVCMMTGTVFCNTCDFSAELMDRLERWTAPLHIMFFVISGAELDMNILLHPLVLLVGVIYIISRSVGKCFGSYASCRLSRCDANVTKYLGITLLPQAGVALGMAQTSAVLQDGDMIRNVVLFAVLIYELVGPLMTKIALTKAGEIKPEGKVSFRGVRIPHPHLPINFNHHK